MIMRAAGTRQKDIEHESANLTIYRLVTLVLHPLPHGKPDLRCRGMSPQFLAMD